MRRFFFMLSTVALAGCGTFSDPTEWFSSTEVVKHSPLVDLQNQIQPQTLWSRDVGSGTDNQRLGLVPRVVGDTVYTADADGRVEAIAIADGSRRWRVELETPVAGGPGVGEGLVVLGTSDAEVIALDVESGGERWRSQVSS